METVVHYIINLCF